MVCYGRERKGLLDELTLLRFVGGGANKRSLLREEMGNVAFVESRECILLYHELKSKYVRVHRDHIFTLPGYVHWRWKNMHASRTHHNYNIM